VKPLKMFALPLECCIALKPLSSEELFVIGIVKAFNDTVSPRLSDGDEHRGDAKMQTCTNHQTKGAWISVAPSEHQSIVQLKEIRHPDSLPGAQEAAGDLPVLLTALGFDVDLMRCHIDDIQRIEPPVSLDVPWTDQVGLVDVVSAQCLGEIRICNPFRGISRFF